MKRFNTKIRTRDYRDYFKVAAAIILLVLFTLVTFIIYINTKNNNRIAWELRMNTELKVVEEGLNSMTMLYYKKANYVISKLDNDPQFALLKDSTRQKYSVEEIYEFNQNLKWVLTDSVPWQRSAAIIYLDGISGYVGVYLSPLDLLGDMGVDKTVEDMDHYEMYWVYDYETNNEKSLNYYVVVSDIMGRAGIIKFIIPYITIEQVISDSVHESAFYIEHLDQDGELIQEYNMLEDATDINNFSNNELLDKSVDLADGSILRIRIPYYLIDREINQRFIRIVIIGLAMIGLLILTVNYSINRVNIDILDFLDNIKKVHLPENTDVPETDSDDKSVNATMKKIMAIIDTMNKVTEEKLNLQQQNSELENDLLQERINPHMLYNSLSALKWRMMDTGNGDMVKFIEALASYYRLALSKGKSYVTINDEIELVKNYVSVVAYAKEQDCKLIVDVDEDLLNEKIPKNLIQPVVENAVLHGLNGVDYEGVVKITGYSDGDLINFSVIDNGHGMNEQTLSKLSNLRYNHNYGGYGMKNLYKRLMMLGGENNSLRIESKPGEGTSVYISYYKIAEDRQ